MAIETTSEPILIITGPTASGKSAVGLRCAQILDAEIISADSRQVYRHLDIGTAKPSPEERNLVRHHGIDICELDEIYDAGQFFHDAETWIRETQQRGRRVIVVGGTGLYVRVLREGLFDGPEADQPLRAELELRLREEGRDVLLADLAKRDPVTAASIDADNPVRLIRALEVCMLTGSPYSQLRKERQKTLPFRFVTVALQWEREALYSRINGRVEAMFEDGLLEETRSLLEQGADPSWNALNTVGYKELAAYFTSLYPLEEAMRLIKRNTRRFAKRQMTWFRKESDLRWFPANNDISAEEQAKRIMQEFLRSNETNT